MSSSFFLKNFEYCYAFIMILLLQFTTWAPWGLAGEHWADLPPHQPSSSLQGLHAQHRVGTWYYGIVIQVAD